MDILRELQQAAQDVTRLFTIMDRSDVMASSAAPLLKSLRAELEKQLAEAVRLTPAALAELEGKRKDSATTLENARANIAAARQSIAAFGTKPPDAPLRELTIPEGQALAAELLARHGIARPVVGTRPKSGEDVASLSSGDFREQTGAEKTAPPAPPPVTPRQPPARPAPGLGSITGADFGSDE